MYNLLEFSEKENKDKNGKHFHDQRKHFSPLILLVDSILGKEALVVLTNLSQLIATKLEEPFSQVRGWFNGLIEIVITRSYYRIICGACLPSPLRYQELDWDPG